MASGATHARIAVAMQFPLTVAGVAVALVDPALGAGIVAGGLVGVFITPDIDHQKRTHEERRIYAFDRTLGIVWQWLWSGYALLMPHRGLSHMIVLGTLTRVLYALFLARMLSWIWYGAASGVCYLANCTLPEFNVWPFLLMYPQAWVGGLLAWMVQDSIHIVTDWLSSGGDHD